MSDEIGARVSRFARQTIDFHLPVLVGLMAEEGFDREAQSRGATALVSLLRSARVESRLMAKGRPVPMQITEEGGERRLVINGEMLARVDDAALATAMAGPVAELLKMSPISVGLVLQLSDERQARGLTGQLGSAGSEVISLTGIEELVCWRLQTFGERLRALVDGLGGRLTAPNVGYDEFRQGVADSGSGWPEWSDVVQTPFMAAWTTRVKGELNHTVWGSYGERLVEMIWESLAISPRSALRQAAQMVRGLTIKADRGQLLEVMAKALDGPEELVDGSLSGWPSFAELQESWTRLWKEEDDALGARRRAFGVPGISVFHPPGESTGVREPENLPWDQPLLCWSMRERAALRDLLRGMQQSLAQTRIQIRSGRLGEKAKEVVSPLNNGGSGHWNIQMPTRVPPIPEGLSDAVDIAFAATRATYLEAFGDLGISAKMRAVNLAKGAYGGYLTSTKSVWKRRLALDEEASLEDHFRTMLTGVANALEWPVFLDVFEEGIDYPPLATMPGFTLLAVWTPGADFAPVWLPIETIGEALGQAPLRIRNVAVDSDGEATWIGDHTVEFNELRALSTDGLLRSVHEGTLMITVHRQ